MSTEPLNSVNYPTPILPPQPVAAPVQPGLQPQPVAAPVQVGLQPQPQAFVVSTVQMGVVSNQTGPFQIFGDVPLNSLHGTFVVCPSCKTPMNTIVTKKFSCLNCLACFFCFDCWLLYKCAFAKDYNCYDAEHTCPKCRAHIGTYSSC